MAGRGRRTQGPLSKTTVVDNVIRYPPSGVKILIVGAGPGGLLTALECWRKGHDIEILEKSPSLSQIGDILVLGPSAWSTLHKYPSMLQEYNEVAIDAEFTPSHKDGRPVCPPVELEWNREGVANHAAYPIRVNTLIGRMSAANLYLNQCRRLGIPITWNTAIVDYEENTAAGYGVAVASDGTRYQADIIVAADGLASKSHRLVLGKHVRAVGTGYTIFRAGIPAADCPNAPLIKEVIRKSDRPIGRAYAGHNHHAVLVLCDRLVCINITLPDDPDQDESVESWSSTVTAEYLIKKIPDFESLDPVLVEATRNFPEGSIVAWKLCMRDPQPAWTSKAGHVVQVGDSAHSFVPTSSNGATMALEDAISLAECLSLSGRDDRLIGVKVHELLRMQRVSLIQKMGLLNRASWHHDKPGEEAIKRVASTVYGKWIWTHNPENYATENFDRARAHLESGTTFTNTNLPPGHKPESWTLDKIIQNEKAGIFEDLTQNGDWSLV